MRSINTLDELEDAIDTGAFQENHYLEAKESLKLTSKRDKLEMARDLAQFAFDGGTIVYGVREEKQTPEARFTLSPLPLVAGVREQIEQTISERTSPHLLVQVTPIETDPDSGEGVIVVQVPPSTLVPHMVDGKYPIRGDSSRRYLNDSEVRLWVNHSEDAKDRVRQILDEHIGQDPYPAASGALNAHVFGVAVPLMSRHDDLPSRSDLHNYMSDAANRFVDQWSQRFHRPDSRRTGSLRNLSLFHAYDAHPRSHEFAMRSAGLNAHLREPGDVAGDVERGFSEWSVDGSGGVRIFDGGLSVLWSDVSGVEEKLTSSIFPVEAAGLLVELARSSAKNIGYYGEWGIGLAGNGLLGVRRGVDYAFANPPVVDRDEVRTVVVVSGYELDTQAGDILDRLARPMLRMLGDEGFLTQDG